MLDRTLLGPVPLDWPSELPHPTALDEGLWYSRLVDESELPAYERAWLDSRYTGVIRTGVAVRTYRAYIGGRYLPARWSLVEAVETIALPGRLTARGMRLAAWLARASDRLTVAMHRLDTRRLARRIRRIERRRGGR